MPDRSARHAPTAPTRILRVGPNDAGLRDDVVAVEEPLAIRVAAGHDRRHLVVTMRTPGHDAELAVGWLYAEGVIGGRSDVIDVSWCARDLDRQDHNAVTVTLRGDHLPDLSGLDRTGTMTSACGICGKASIDQAISSVASVPEPSSRVPTTVLWDLPDQLRAAQEAFGLTGGLHAAGIAATDGTLLGVREDVGRHNALDKLVGAAVFDGDLPWTDRILVLSGRASFELIQKAAMAGVGTVCSIGAPSTMAVEMAERSGIALIGFLRSTGANVYSRAGRLDVTDGVAVAS